VVWEMLIWFDKFVKNPGGTETSATGGEARPKRIRIGGKVAAAELIERVQPEYPEEARKNGISGTVRLHVVALRDGTMKEVQLVSGHPLLAPAAITAVGRWRYKPTLLNGEPVEVDTTVDVIFSLEP